MEDSRPCWNVLIRVPQAENCECLYVKSCSFYQEKGVVSKYEIKDVKEITKIKICLEGENMTRKYIAEIILRHLSQSHFFSLITSNKYVVISTAHSFFPLRIVVLNVVNSANVYLE